VGAAARVRWAALRADDATVRQAHHRSEAVASSANRGGPLQRAQGDSNSHGPNGPKALNLAGGSPATRDSVDLQGFRARAQTRWTHLTGHLLRKVLRRRAKRGRADVSKPLFARSSPWWIPTHRPHEYEPCPASRHFARHAGSRGRRPPQMKALDLEDENAAAYLRLAEEQRQSAAQLLATGEEMAGYRDLPAARHDPKAMTSPQVADTFEKFVKVEQERLALLEERIEQDRAMLRDDGLERQPIGSWVRRRIPTHGHGGVCSQLGGARGPRPLRAICGAMRTLARRAQEESRSSIPWPRDV
jgi:hypothetical protein